MTVITLLTDFGYSDGYPGVMKGVIWSIAPNVHIADITHEIQPQDVYQATLTLARSAPFFPPGTIHVAVVDPGVGTHRRPLAMQLGEQFYVGPDNGSFTRVIEMAETRVEFIQIIHLDQPAFWLPYISQVFHGRDIFAPVAAHLATGVPLHALGKSIKDPIRLNFQKPVPTTNGWSGIVAHIDHFGNLSTNISTEIIDQNHEIVIMIKGRKITGLVSAFGDNSPGTLVALMDSSGYLMISIVNGNAADFLQAGIGEPIEISMQK